MNKAVYEAPTVAEVGTFETITQGSTNGSVLDGTFAVGTPQDQLTFS